MALQINAVRTPDMLKLWGMFKLLIVLFVHTNNVRYITFSWDVDQGRYTWRHDSVLQDIESALSKVITVFNGRKPTCFGEIAKKDYKQSFVTAGVRGTKRSSDPRS